MCDKKLIVVEKKCPYCNEKIVANKKVFANHIRWCKKNPRYQEIVNGFIKKIKIKRQNSTNSSKTYIRKCDVCGKEYEIKATPYIWGKQKIKKTCSDECAKQLTAKKTNQKSKGDKTRSTILQKIENGKWILPNGKLCEGQKNHEKKCPVCNKKFVTIKKWQQFCSNKCSAEDRHNKTIEKKEIFDIYKSQTHFNFALSDYPKEFNFRLIEENGWYHPKNHGDNLHGVSRDHMFSVNEGFKQNIDPYYISHPANCELLKHNDNASKFDKCSITKTELIKRVFKWNKKYGVYPNKILYKGIENFKSC